MKPTRDPFASRNPMAENHPVMEYLNWQIACHVEHLSKLCNGWFDSSVEQMKRDLDRFDVKEYGIPDRSIVDFEYTLGEMRRVNNQLNRLKRERLRLQKDVDFRNGNYLL